MQAQIVRELPAIRNTPGWRYAQALSEAACRRRLQRYKAASIPADAPDGEPAGDLLWLPRKEESPVETTTIRSALAGWARTRAVEIRACGRPHPGTLVQLAAGTIPNRHAIAKLDAALASLADSVGLPHPWAGREVNYNVVPVSMDYHPTLDMALIAASITNLDGLDCLYSGEVDVSGGFPPPPFPLEVGRAAVEMDKPLVVPGSSAPLGEQAADATRALAAALGSAAVGEEPA
jgi:hypothetical protein